MNINKKEKIYPMLCQLLADTYALYLKTQNYHWHVTGVHFRSLHAFFEDQYSELLEAADLIAERIRSLGWLAPATFSEYNRLKTISDGDSNYTPNEMIRDLCNDHEKVIDDLYASLKICQSLGDEGGVSLLGDRISKHEKMRWMLIASRS